MKKFLDIALLALFGILNAAETAPRLNEFGALELDGTSWFVSFRNMKWISFFL